MDCKEVARFLQVYVDGELDEADRRVLEEHLSDCADCRAQVDYEQRFRAALRARLPRPAAPADFRARIENKLSGTSDRVFPRRLMWSSVPAVAALALAITFTWTVTSGFSNMVDEAVEQHSTEPAVEVNSSDTHEVEDWFKRRVDFRVALPRFGKQKLDLVGARMSQLAEQRAALVRYRHGGRNVSLFVVSDPGGALEGKSCRRVRSRKICLSERRGYSVVMWRSRGLTYSLVGDSAPGEMLDVLSTAPSF